MAMITGGEASVIMVRRGWTSRGEGFCGSSRQEGTGGRLGVFACEGITLAVGGG